MARKIPFDDPEVLNYVRAGYVTVQLLVLSTYYYISMKVSASNPILHKRLVSRRAGAFAIGQAKERPDGVEVWCVILLV